MKKYNIEGGIDFFSELYKPQEYEENKLKMEDDNNLCLITNQPLTDKFVTMECGHKFNYIPLFNDLVNHKKKFNNMEGTATHLKNNEIVVKKKNSTNLTTEIKKYGLPFYIKVDCEGAEELILKNLDYRIRIISFEANLPKFLGNTLNIMGYFDNKFNSLFNLRRNNQFNFIFKTNTKLDEVKNFLLLEKDTFEVFVFNE